jgi:arsenate reductase
MSYSVLFLCTGNSARSIMAEAILRRLGQDRFRAYSAGSLPRGAVHPLAIEVLREFGHPVDGLRSKSWEEFFGPGAPSLDCVITVCARAAREACPLWHGPALQVHWVIADPAVDGEPEPLARGRFRQAYRAIHERIASLVALPVEEMNHADLHDVLKAIGARKTAA